jgi:tetratricopeptide (TPR) repeat protein
MSPVGDDGPYVGLRSYEPPDSKNFFGRDQESRDVRSLWLSDRLLVLYGPSGAGKSSLVKAGVLPALTDYEVDLLPVGRLSPGLGAEPKTGSGGNSITFALLSSWAPEEPAERLRTSTLKRFLDLRPVLEDTYGDRMPVLAAIDQFEELFTAPQIQPLQREAFIGELAGALAGDTNLRLLVSIREDFLAALMPYEAQLAARSRQRFRLTALSPDAALDAVQLPLQGTHRKFARGVAKRLVDNLRTRSGTGQSGELDPCVEPVQLQVVCSALWRALPRSVETITFEHLATYGDVDRTLADFYDDVVAKTAREHTIAETDLRNWIEKTFITEISTRGTAYEGGSLTAGLPNNVAHSLENHHLLRAERRAGARWYELQHDRLIPAIRQADRAASERRDQPAGPDDDLSRYLELAQNALKQANLPEAEAWALAVCEAESAETRIKVEATLLLARVLDQRGAAAAADRYQEAAAMFEALGDTSAVAGVLTELGNWLLGRGDHVTALEQYQAALRRLPGDLEAQDGFARALWYAGRLGGAMGALGVYIQILSRFPSYPPALSGRGQILAEVGKPEDALSDLDRALPMFAGDQAETTHLRSARALALARLRRLPDAEQEIGLAERADPRNAWTSFRAAQVSQLRGDLVTARKRLKKSLESSASPPLLPYQENRARKLLAEASADH